MTKLGTTKQIFSGANTYIGQTQVNAGTLLINGTHVDAETVTSNGYGNVASGHFQVANGATFGGSGRITGKTTQNNSNMVLVQSGGTLAPGEDSAIGTLVLDGAAISGTNSRVLNMALNSEFSFKLAGDGSSADQIAMWNYASGDLLLNGNKINLTLTGPLEAGTYTVTLFSFYNDSGTTLTNSGIASGLTLGNIDPNISGTPMISYNGDTIKLTYVITVPEPSAFVLAGLGLAFILRHRRKREASGN